MRRLSWERWAPWYGLWGFAFASGKRIRIGRQLKTALMTLMIAMKLKNLLSVLITSISLVFLASSISTARAASPESEARAVVQRVFDQLKAGQFDSLYDALPTNWRGRMSRAQFNSTMQRTRSMYQLDRLDVGAVHVANNLAVVDTVMYGRVMQPLAAEGKIVVQQYLIREDGNWRVATGDNQTIRRFLAANPAFGKKFSIRPPRVFVKQNGGWTEVNLSRLPRKGK